MQKISSLHSVFYKESEEYIVLFPVLTFESVGGENHDSGDHSIVFLNPLPCHLNSLYLDTIRPVNLNALHKVSSVLSIASLKFTTVCCIRGHSLIFLPSEIQHVAK